METGAGSSELFFSFPPHYVSVLPLGSFNKVLEFPPLENQRFSLNARPNYDALFGFFSTPVQFSTILFFSFQNRKLSHFFPLGRSPREGQN